MPGTWRKNPSPCALQVQITLQDKALIAIRCTRAYHIDEGYAVLLHGIQVLLKISARQDTAMYDGVQRLHPPCIQPPLSTPVCS